MALDIGQQIIRIAAQKAVLVIFNDDAVPRAHAVFRQQRRQVGHGFRAVITVVRHQEQAAAAPISQIRPVAAVRQSLREPVRHIIGHGGMRFEKFFCFFTPGKNHAIVLHRLRRLINVQPFPGRFPYDRGVIQAAILL